MAAVQQEGVLRAFLDTVDTLVEDDFDLIDVLHRLCARSVEFLDVAAVGIMLADPHGDLHMLAASDESERMLALFGAQSRQGPCPVSYRSGQPCLDVDLASDHKTGELAAFAARAREMGFVTAHALPMRLRRRTVGALGVLHTAPGPLTSRGTRLGQTLADVATIAILQHRTIEHGNVERAQLQNALTSRIVIEQAKGILAERWQVRVDEAFRTMRSYARSHHARLDEVSRQVIDGGIDTERLRAGAAGKAGKAGRTGR
ncbi:transcriptional regulator [Streptomyces ruber]|uniref:Transcriptional regulator n=2 Tax=Streptomyces TaxID=1883 RepID=A0A918BG73_9ACTN|nr:GAF and ANTAR domain-containing protein [Streptomyces ruber]GGQ64525.1 transcriptional regulator [Streptomyces ruber]